MSPCSPSPPGWSRAALRGTKGPATWYLSPEGRSDGNPPLLCQGMPPCCTPHPISLEVVGWT